MRLTTLEGVTEKRKMKCLWPSAPSIQEKRKFGADAIIERPPGRGCSKNMVIAWTGVIWV